MIIAKVMIKNQVRKLCSVLEGPFFYTQNLINKKTENKTKKQNFNILKY